jgi:hypothetical protein
MLSLNGASLNALGTKFNASRDAIWRHMKDHVSAEAKAHLLVGARALKTIEELKERAADESMALVDYLSIVRSVLFRQFLGAAEAFDRNGTALIAGKLIESLRELARLSGELRELSGLTINNQTNVVNLFASPEFARLSEGLLSVCRSHPAARADIVALLRSLDGPSGSSKEALGRLSGKGIAPRPERPPTGFLCGLAGLPRSRARSMRRDGLLIVALRRAMNWSHRSTGSFDSVDPSSAPRSSSKARTVARSIASARFASSRSRSDRCGHRDGGRAIKPKFPTSEPSRALCDLTEKRRALSRIGGW